MPSTVQILEYLDATGRSPFAHWFERLNPVAAARVARSVYQLEAGNFSNVKSVGNGVLEQRLDVGPGFRIYFGRYGDTMVILLGGSDKRRQSAAIVTAQERWAEFKRRKTSREKPWH
jgi:putative addiction module killer protein